MFLTEKQIVPVSLQYPGLTALARLPEHKSVIVTDKNDTTLVDIQNNDGYSVTASLRKPVPTDFRSHPEKQAHSAGQLIVEEDIVVTVAGQELRLLEEFQKAYPSSQQATIALEASSPHLRKPVITNDVLARSLFYASRGALNPRGNTANHKDSHSVRLDVFPSTDLTLFFLIHELVELSGNISTTNAQFVQAKQDSNNAYFAAKKYLVESGVIPESEKGHALMKRIVGMVEQGNLPSSDPVLVDSAAKYYWYMAVQQMMIADNEKSVNGEAYNFLVATIPGLKEDTERLTRLKKMIAVLARWYDLQVGTWQKKAMVVSGSHATDFDSFFSQRSYDFPVSELDTTLQTWLDLIKSL